LLPMRFVWRLYAGYFLLIVLASLGAVLFVSRQVERESLTDIERNLENQARLLAELSRGPLSGGEPTALQSRVIELGKLTGTRYTLIAGDGRVLADSEEDPARMTPHGTRPEVLDARRYGIGMTTRHSQTLNEQMLYLALPVMDGDRSLGTVRTALPLDRVRSRLAETRRMILLGAVLASTLALLIGIVVARRSTIPLRGMTAAARAVATGRAHAQVPESRGSVEMRELAAAFNSMAAQLRERMGALETERSKLAAILAGMNEGVLAVDAQERILHVNGLAADILRLDPDRDAGLPVWECSRISEACELLSQCLAHGSFLRRETTVLSDGHQRIIELKASPLPGEGGRPCGAVLVLNEVTDLRQLEAMRRDFIANASHELKTPLTVIQGVVETLNEEPSMDEGSRRRFVEKLHHQTTRLASLVRDLLSLSRYEASGTQLGKEPLDLGELAAECARDHRAAAEAKGLSFAFEPAERPLPLTGDRSALRQALDNLLANAIQYTPAGGRVRLSVRPSEGHAVAEVEDTGIGIEPAHQARIFERFYRVDKARSRELGGTGLGLSIVRNAVLGHGGQVSVESAPGRGSRFRIRIPLALRD